MMMFARSSGKFGFQKVTPPSGCQDKSETPIQASTNVKEVFPKIPPPPPPAQLPYSLPCPQQAYNENRFMTNMADFASGKVGYSHFSKEANNKDEFDPARCDLLMYDFSSGKDGFLKPAQGYRTSDNIRESTVKNTTSSAALPQIMLEDGFHGDRYVMAMVDASSSKQGFSIEPEISTQGRAPAMSAKGEPVSSQDHKKGWFGDLRRHAEKWFQKKPPDKCDTNSCAKAEDENNSHMKTDSEQMATSKTQKLKHSKKATEPAFVRDRDLIMRMLRREQQLRMCEETQQLYDCPERGEDPNIPPRAIEDSIQLQVLREYMILPTAENLHWYRCLNGLYIDDPEVRSCIVYMTHDVSREGELRPGDQWPDVTLRTIENQPVKLSEVYSDGKKPLVLIGASGS